MRGRERWEASESRSRSTSREKKRRNRNRSRDRKGRSRGRSRSRSRQRSSRSRGRDKRQKRSGSRGRDRKRRSMSRDKKKSRSRSRSKSRVLKTDRLSSKIVTRPKSLLTAKLGNFFPPGKSIKRFQETTKISQTTKTFIKSMPSHDDSKWQFAGVRNMVRDGLIASPDCDRFNVDIFASRAFLGEQFEDDLVKLDSDQAFRDLVSNNLLLNK
jgi:hypothetical protein